MWIDKNVHRGRFVVFEGLDGSGTSTQARLLHEALVREGYQAFITSEPTNGPVGSLIRLAMSHRLFFSGSEENDDKQLAYLFAADRFDHLYNVVDGIINSITKGGIIVSTRYYLSSFAYHCNNERDFEFVGNLNNDFPPPDITFFIDCPVDICIQRINASRAVPEKYENVGKLKMVRENYMKAMDEYKKKSPIIVLDGRLETDSLHRQILDQVRRIL